MKPIDLRTKAPSVLHTQYCIIGSGVAGIVLAASLVNQGKRVMLLDAGGVGFDASAQDGARADHVSYPYADPLQSRLRQLGGASNHWSNNTSPLDEIDFEKRPWIKDSGWPINRAELTPYYRDAALWCQTGGDGYEAEYWKERGLKAPESFSNDRVLVNIAKASVPATAFFKVHGSRLSQHPELSWFTYADVVDIDFDIVHNMVRQATTSTGHRVSAEKFILATGGLENARLLKIFNIKYNGKLGDQNDAVGRYFMDHPTLNGAHLFTPDSSVLHSMQGKMFDTRLVVPFFQLQKDVLSSIEGTNVRMPIASASLYDMSEGLASAHQLRKKLSSFQLDSTIASLWTKALVDADVIAMTAAYKMGWEPAKHYLNTQLGFQIPLMMEQTPSRENKVYLSNKKDRNGLPLLSIKWELSKDDKDKMWRTLQVLAREVGYSGIGRMRLLTSQSDLLFGDQLGFGHHHMGTTRMSDSPDSGVVDKNHLVFGTENLFVAGCSVFATGSHLPPTLTIVAMTLRLAQLI